MLGSLASLIKLDQPEVMWELALYIGGTFDMDDCGVISKLSFKCGGGGVAHETDKDNIIVVRLPFESFRKLTDLVRVLFERVTFDAYAIDGPAPTTAKTLQKMRLAGIELVTLGSADGQQSTTDCHIGALIDWVL